MSNVEVNPVEGVSDEEIAAAEASEDGEYLDLGGDVLVNGEYLALLQSVIALHNKLDNMASFMGAQSQRLDTAVEGVQQMNVFLAGKFPPAPVPSVGNVPVADAPEKPDFLKN
jgi:hypothetical protein